jgi:hypothetical protein
VTDQKQEEHVHFSSRDGGTGGSSATDRARVSDSSACPGDL